jgi:ribose 5-phosphate isomerase RpiB
MDSDLTRDIVRAYLAATFEGNRHLRRVNKIKKLEESQQ